MKEKSTPEVSLEEWLKQKQQDTNNKRVRAEAFHDTTPDLAPMNAKDTFSWLVYTLREVNNLYTVLEMMNGDGKILEKRVRDILALSLGLSGDSAWEQINARAKEFGEFAQSLIDKGKEEKEAAEKAARLR
jgi:hypothetical protein